MSTVATPPRSRTAIHTPTLTRGTLVATAFAVMVAQVGLAIPAVLNGLFQQDLSTTSSQLTWISDAFLVPVTLFELTFGVLGDLFGRRRLLIGGSALMVVGELVSVLTPTPGASNTASVATLWVGQGLAGLGAAVLLPTTLAMVAAGTHTARDRARAIAIWAAALAAGGFVSPLLGGALATQSWGGSPTASWRWAFVAVAVLALVGTALSFAAQNSSAPEGRSLDLPGQITIAVSLFALLFAVIQGPTTGWTSPVVLGGFVVAVVFFALFVAAERRSPAPLLRLDLFANRAFSVISLVTVVGMFAYLGTAYATSIRLSAIQGLSPLTTAVAFVLLNGFALVLMPLTARALHSHDPRWAVGGGFALIAVGDFWLATESATDRSIWPVVAPLALAGIGFAFALAGVTAVAVNAVPEQLAGMASGTTSQLRDFGFTLGPAVIGAVALSRAATDVQGALASSPDLQSALADFSASAPPEAVGAVTSGPLGANAVAGNPIQQVAFAALDHAYSLGFVICGVAAGLAAVITVALLGRADGQPVDAA